MKADNDSEEAKEKRKMNKVTGYLASDGTFFQNGDDCIMHNAAINLINTLHDNSIDDGIVIPLIHAHIHTFHEYITAQLRLIKKERKNANGL